MKLKKGSAEAKKFMASIRAKKKGAKKATAKKLSGTKKIAGVKYPKPKLFKPTKKETSAAAKRLAKQSLHKDTKSHNVKISVVSGLKNDVLSALNDTFKKIDRYTDMKNTYSKMIKNKTIHFEDKKHYKYMYTVANKHLLSLKKEIILLKKLL